MLCFKVEKLSQYKNIDKDFIDILNAPIEVFGIKWQIKVLVVKNDMCIDIYFNADSISNLKFVLKYIIVCIILLSNVNKIEKQIIN